MKNYQFKDVEFMTADEKQLVLKDWIKFLKQLNLDNGEECLDNFGNSMPKLFKYFTKRLYSHLSLHCSFIAHYDRFGFFNTYFNEPEQTQLFLKQFTNGKSIEYGSHWWLNGDHADINNAMCEMAREIAGTITDKKAIEQRKIDIERAKQLLAKHDLELKLKESN
jgi:hypothetical protein